MPLKPNAAGGGDDADDVLPDAAGYLGQKRRQGRPCSSLYVAARVSVKGQAAILAGGFVFRPHHPRKRKKNIKVSKQLYQLVTLGVILLFTPL